MAISGAPDGHDVLSADHVKLHAQPLTGRVAHTQLPIDHSASKFCPVSCVNNVA
jgi:hypothetical protein